MVRAQVYPVNENALVLYTSGRPSRVVGVRDVTAVYVVHEFAACEVQPEISTDPALPPSTKMKDEASFPLQIPRLDQYAARAHVEVLAQFPRHVGEVQNIDQTGASHRIVVLQAVRLHAGSSRCRCTP